MLKGVSLFANVGMAETYLQQNDIDIVVANELLEKRVKFYQHLYPEATTVQGDITDDAVYGKVLEESRASGCDFLMATPPCQGMSQAGQMLEDDPRNSLIIKAIQLVGDLNVKFALIENVPKMLKTSIIYKGKEVKIIDFINNKLKDKYKINFKVVNTSNYGVPQNRKRIIVLISRLDQEEWVFPEENHDIITVRDSIGDLPSLESGKKSKIPHHVAKKHNDNHILWMKHTPTGQTAFKNEVHFPQKDNRRIKGYDTTYKRIEWDQPSPTITMANGSISSQNNVHPGKKKKDGTYSDARVLTLLEIFRLSSLPDDWNVPSWANDNLIRAVVGEGIPPKLILELTKQLRSNKD